MGMMEPGTSKVHRRWRNVKAWWVTRMWYRRMFGELGPRTVITPPLSTVHPECAALGSGVRIGPSCRIETHPPLSRSKKPVPLIRIGDRVRIGRGVRLVGTVSLTIGDGAWIEDGCTITDREYAGLPEGPAYWRQNPEGRPTSIGEGAWIGAGSAVLAGSRIGARAIILPGSVVDGEIPPRTVAAGVPAKVIRVYDGNRKGWADIRGEPSMPSRSPWSRNA